MLCLHAEGLPAMISLPWEAKGCGEGSESGSRLECQGSSGLDFDVRLTSE